LFKQFQQFETVVENMSDALFILYPDSAAISLNQEAHFIKHLFNGFSKMDKNQSEIKYYDENGKEIPYDSLPAFKILQGEHYKAFRVTVKTRDNTHHFSISGRPVFDNAKNIFFSIVCIRDVTSQVNHDNYILKVEKEKKEYLERVIRLKDDFLTLISHEFKTPLTVIGTAIQAMELLCGKELSSKTKRYIDTIRQNSLRQLRLVSNLLDITRGTADQIRLHKKSVDIVLLTRLITDSVKIYAAQKNLQIIFISDFDKKIVFVDDEKYERIVLNLLSNAIKFTPKGKSIQVRLYKEKDFINLEVKDEGVGIPKEKIGLIFERFGQVDNSLSRQAEGTGIGLYLVKMFVERMGGSISASSTLYKGATFLVKLPDESNGQHGMVRELETVDNKKIVHMMNIEFSDIYLSK
jgi:signal transduction histidine kinase